MSPADDQFTTTITKTALGKDLPRLLTRVDVAGALFSAPKTESPVPKRVLVCGGRDFNDYGMLKTVLDTLEPRPQVIISGLARGADSLAVRWANENGVKVEGYAADWKRHGLHAGPIRNRKMLEEGRPDLVIAFPGGTGTAHMVEISKKAGVPVFEVR